MKGDTRILDFGNCTVRTHERDYHDKGYSVGVSSVERQFELLAAMRVLGGALTIRQLSEHIGMPLSTTQSCIYALVHKGLAVLANGKKPYGYKPV